MTASPTPDRTPRTGTLIGIAAVIAAVALLLLGLSALQRARGPAAETTPPAEPGLAAATAYPGQGIGESLAAASALPADAASAYPAGAATASGSAEPLAASPAAVEPGVVVGADTVAVVEDWGAFADVEQVESAISRNLGMGDNFMELSLLDAAGAFAGRPGLQMSFALGARAGLAIRYAISETAPHDFVGFDRDLDQPQDWRGATHVQVWLDPGEGSAEGPDVQVVFQWREASDEVWRYSGSLRDVPSGSPLLIPITEDSFHWATWSREEDGEIDREAVDQYGLYVGHAGPDVSGLLAVGTISAVRQ